MHSEAIEWLIGKRIQTLNEPDRWTFHTEGAQSIFGLTRARKVAKALGPPWEVLRMNTLESPKKD